MRRALDVVINVVLVAALICICIRVYAADLTKAVGCGLTIAGNLTRRWIVNARNLITDHSKPKDEDYVE